MDPFWLALGLTAFAGLATVLGGVLGVLGAPPTRRRLAVGLGLAAGVMISISFMEILPKAAAGLATEVGDSAELLALVGFLVGAGAFMLLDRFVPASVDISDPDVHLPVTARRLRLMRLGLVTALGMGLHNLPEGFATFAGTVADPVIGVSLAVAMAIHNIPEGLAVAVPIRQATGSRRRALFWASVIGVAEPVGALIGYLVLAPLLTDALLGFLFASIAGLMIVISFDKLLPTAHEAGGHRVTLAGALVGMVVMMASLAMLG